MNGWSDEWDLTKRIDGIIPSGQRTPHLNPPGSSNKCAGRPSKICNDDFLVLKSRLFFVNGGSFFFLPSNKQYILFWSAHNPQFRS